MPKRVFTEAQKEANRKRTKLWRVTAKENLEKFRNDSLGGVLLDAPTMKVTREDPHSPSSADMELMMECVEEELMPWQKEASEQAETEYAAVCIQIEEAKRKLIDKQMERRLEMERQVEMETQRLMAEQAASESVQPNHTIEPPNARPASPDIIILDDGPDPTSSAPKKRRRRYVLGKPQGQTDTPMTRFPNGPTPVILPIPGRGTSGGMLLMQPPMTTQVINAQTLMAGQVAPILQGSPLPGMASKVPGVAVQHVYEPSNSSNIHAVLMTKAADQTTPVRGTHGLGIKRGAGDTTPSPPPIKRRPKTPSNMETQGSGDWVPLDEYYYGKKEGDPAYVEEKAEYRFKCWYCNKMLYNNLRVMAHMQGHIDSEKQLNLELCDITQCKHCYKQFDTPFEMQCHIEKVHQNKSNVLVCRICEKDHDSQLVLRNHMRQCHKACEMPYICHLCNFRSSVYSDVVDHFKKRHDNSGYVMCLYCLRAFKTHFSKLYGWGLTTTYYQHLLKHQHKATNKKCPNCKLTFINKAEVKVHCKNDHMPNFKGILGSNEGETLTSDKQQVMIQLPDSAGRSVDKSPGNELKSLNVSSGSKQQDYADFKMAVEPWHMCVECKMPMDSSNHFKKYIECSMCRYATICSAAYAYHMINFHSRSAQRRSDCVPRDRKMTSKMYCLCGYGASHGNNIANHLVVCSKRTCYTQKPEIKLPDPDDNQDANSEETDSVESDDVPGKNVPSLFGALGLIKKAQKRNIYKKRGFKRALPVVPNKPTAALGTKSTKSPQRYKPSWMSKRTGSSRSKYSIFDGGIRSPWSTIKRKSTEADTATGKADDNADTAKSEMDDPDTETGKPDDTSDTAKSETYDADVAKGKTDETSNSEKSEMGEADMATSKNDDTADTTKTETDDANTATGKPDDTSNAAKTETDDENMETGTPDDAADLAKQDANDADMETSKTDDGEDTVKRDIDEADMETGKPDDTLNAAKSETDDADMSTAACEDTVKRVIHDADTETGKPDDIADTEKCEKDKPDMATGKSDDTANIVASDRNKDSVQDEKSSDSGESDRKDATGEESNTTSSPNIDEAINDESTSPKDSSEKVTEPGSDTGTTAAAMEGINGVKSVEHFGSTIDGDNGTDASSEDSIKTCVSEAVGATESQVEGKTERDTVTSTLTNDTCDRHEMGESTVEKPDGSGVGENNSGGSIDAPCSDPPNVDNSVQSESGDIEKGEATTQEPSLNVATTEALPQTTEVLPQVSCGPKTDKGVTGDASSRNNAISTGVNSRGQDRNHASDQSHKHSDYGRHDATHERGDRHDYNRRDGSSDRWRDRRGDDRDRHRDRSHDRYGGAQRDRYDASGSRNNRDNQRDNRDRHDNRSYDGGRKSSDRRSHDNRRGDDRDGYYGNRNYY